mgnify:CR=1 FL=1
MAEISDLISSIQNSGLDAECPECGETSALSSWTLFDGLKPFPTDAEQKKQEMEESLQTDWEKLDKDKKRIKISKTSAVAGGKGKITEVLIPVMKGFGYKMEDCRFLANPIDYIVFEGVSQGNVDHITFMDVKTGKTGDLDKHQKKIRDTINDNNVKFKVV